MGVRLNKNDANLILIHNIKIFLINKIIEQLWISHDFVSVNSGYLIAQHQLTQLTNSNTRYLIDILV